METRAKASQDTNVRCSRREHQNTHESLEKNKQSIDKGRDRNMLNGIIEIDVYGKNVESAIEEVRKHLNNAKPSVYRIRIIHGYHGGTRIREGIREEFSYGREPKVKRITMGDNQGITELVLREF